MYSASRGVLVRVMWIDREIRAGRYPNTESLEILLKVDERTIRRDIKFMRERLEAPLGFDRRRNGYYYTEPTYRLPYFQLREGELLAIFVADQLLRQFHGTPFEADIDRTLKKLAEMLPDEMSIRLDSIADFLSVLPVAKTKYNHETFHALTSAALGRRRLEIKYWAASRNEVTKRQFDPYEITLVDDGWYAIGHCHLRNDIRMFAIQRIKRVRETDKSFERPAGFSAERYLRGSFRAMRGEGDYRVVLRFKPDAARRMREKKWHATQVLKREPDGSLIARLQLTSLIEVKRWIMWWGTDCEVIEPEELRELVRVEIAEMLARADNGPPTPAAPVREESAHAGRRDVGFAPKQNKRFGPGVEFRAHRAPLSC